MKTNHRSTAAREHSKPENVIDDTEENLHRNKSNDQDSKYVKDEIARRSPYKDEKGSGYAQTNENERNPNGTVEWKCEPLDERDNLFGSINTEREIE